MQKSRSNRGGRDSWTKGFYVNWVGADGDEDTIQKYVKAQGIQKEYQKLYVQQLSLF